MPRNRTHFPEDLLSLKIHAAEGVGEPFADRPAQRGTVLSGRWTALLLGGAIAAVLVCVCAVSPSLAAAWRSDELMEVGFGGGGAAGDEANPHYDAALRRSECFSKFWFFL